MKKIKLILPDADGGKDHLIADTFDEAFLLNIDCNGSKNEIQLGIEELIQLNKFITNHIELWPK